MIILSLSDTKKHVVVVIDDPTLGKLTFWRESASELEAKLLQTHLDAIIDRNMEQIRKVSYLRGWRDAKSKRPKESWWATWSAVLPWESKGAGL